MSIETQIVVEAFRRGIAPDPNMPVDEWSDEIMIIPKDSGANEYGKYRTSRTPHARMIMQKLSDNDPCKRVVLMGASQMMKSQIGLNFLGASIHQSPANFLWVVPTGKLQKRASTRISKTISAVPELSERVAAPRSRDSVNTLDTKEYIGGALYIVSAGAAANLSEVSARRMVYDEIDRSDENVNKEGSPGELGEARLTTFERNRKSYYPSSPTIEGESAIQDLFKTGTQRVALADCPHCNHAQPLIFERLQISDDGQLAMYPCIECGAMMFEEDKNRMFERGAWSDGVDGDGETESFTIDAMFIGYGGLSWLSLHRQYTKAKLKLEQGSEESMIVFYNTRLARCWERKKEQTKYDELMARAEPYKLGYVPAGGLILTAAGDTQVDRVEIKVIAWGEGMEGWIVDYQVIQGSPAEDATWLRVDEVMKNRYQHANGQYMEIAGTLIDSGGANTQDVYNYTYSRRRRTIFACKGASKPNRPIISSKPTLVDINHRGKTEKRGAQLWFVGTDTAKDYLAGRWKRAHGPGAIHFSSELQEDYFKQLTAEYRTTGYKRGRKVSWWEKKAADRNEAGDLMVYNLAAAYLLGLHKKSAAYWNNLRARLNPSTPDLFNAPPAMMAEPVRTSAHKMAAILNQADPQPLKSSVTVSDGKISLSGMRRGR